MILYFEVKFTSVTPFLHLKVKKSVKFMQKLGWSEEKMADNFFFNNRLFLDLDSQSKSESVKQNVVPVSKPVNTERVIPPPTWPHLHTYSTTRIHRYHTQVGNKYIYSITITCCYVHILPKESHMYLVPAFTSHITYINILYFFE